MGDQVAAEFAVFSGAGAAGSGLRMAGRVGFGCASMAPPAPSLAMLQLASEAACFTPSEEVVVQPVSGGVFEVAAEQQEAGRWLLVSRGGVGEGVVGGIKRSPFVAEGADPGVPPVGSRRWRVEV